MKHLSKTDLEASLYEIIAEVVLGESVVVTDDTTGEPIAKLEPSGKLRNRQKLRIAAELLNGVKTDQPN